MAKGLSKKLPEGNKHLLLQDEHKIKGCNTVVAAPASRTQFSEVDCAVAECEGMASGQILKLSSNHSPLIP